MIAIVGAMNEEVETLLQKLDDYQKKEINGFIFFIGKVYNHDVVISKSGVGKVFASILATTLFTSFDISLFINLGVCGGMGDIQLGDIVVAEKVIYSDVDVTTFPKYKYGQVPNGPWYYLSKYINLEKLPTRTYELYKGDIITSDKFINDYYDLNEVIDSHFKDFNILACDMESAAFAQTCYHFKKDFIIVRSISDLIDRKDETESYTDDNLAQASLNSSQCVLDILKNL